MPRPRDKSSNADLVALRLRVRKLEDEVEHLRVSSEDASLQAEQYAKDAVAQSAEFEARVTALKSEQLASEDAYQTEIHALEAAFEDLKTTNEELRPDCVA